MDIDKTKQPTTIKTPYDYRKEIEKANLIATPIYRRLDLELKAAILEQLIEISKINRPILNGPL